MNIVLAQFRKDIRCQRRPLILWVVCLASGVIPFVVLKVMSHMEKSHLAHLDLSAGQMVAGTLSFIAIFTACMSAAAFGMFLLLPLLVIRVVHDDPLMGTTAFWLTRPMPRQKLMLAKVLFIAILLLPLLLGLGAGMRAGHNQFWPAEMAWIAAVAALAAITPTTQAWIGYGLELLFGKIIFSGIIDRVWDHYHGAGGVLSDGMADQLSSAGRLLHLNVADGFHLCYLAGFSAVFIHQYLTLRTRRSVAMFIAVLLAISLLQMVANPFADSPGAIIQFNSNTGPTP